jgi:ABC-type nitrate/sulfonate/bicarbonate transport system permease component
MPPKAQLDGRPAPVGSSTGTGLPVALRKVRRAPATVRIRRALTPVAATLGVLALAQLASLTGVVDPRYVPPVSRILARLGDLVAGGGVWQPLWDTLSQALMALGLALLIAVPIGLVTGLFRVAEDLTAYIVELMRPVPAVALIPLLILIVGTGSPLAVSLGVFAGTWPVLIQTRFGLRDVDPVALDTARVFGLPWTARLRWVILPSAAPHIITGARVSATLALILAVSAELVAGSPGLGHDVGLAQSAADPESMYAFVVVIGLLGVLVDGSLRLVQRHFLSWLPSQRKELAQ